MLTLVCPIKTEHGLQFPVRYDVGGRFVQVKDKILGLKAVPHILETEKLKDRATSNGH